MTDTTLSSYDLTAAPMPLKRVEARRPGPSWVGLLGNTRAAPKQRAFFFVSYCRADLPAVRPILQRLRAGGRRLWVDTGNLMPGRHWTGEIMRAIRASQAVIVFCSKQAFASGHVFREVAAAARFNKIIIPVFLDDSKAPDEFLYYLSVHEAVRLRNEGALAHLAGALDALAPPAAPREPTRPARRQPVAPAPVGATPVTHFVRSATISFITVLAAMMGAMGVAVTGGLPNEYEIETFTRAAENLADSMEGAVMDMTGAERRLAAQKQSLS